jgi:hypothetical protein
MGGVVIKEVLCVKHGGGLVFFGGCPSPGFPCLIWYWILRSTSFTLTATNFPPDGSFWRL